MLTPMSSSAPRAAAALRINSTTTHLRGLRSLTTQSQRQSSFSSQARASRSNRLAVAAVPALTPAPTRTPLPSSRLRLFSSSAPARAAGSSEEADKIMEEIQDLYLMAKDEFEIAYEETTKNTVYAQEDRDAAVEELKTLKEAYDGVLNSQTISEEVKAEVKKRAGTRIRELEAGVERMLEEAMEHD